MASTPAAPPTYLDRLRSDLDLIEADFVQILADSQIRNTDPNRGRDYVMHVGAPKWGWVPSSPELEARRMELLGRVREHLINVQVVLSDSPVSIRQVG
ncbi:hypothetical protein, partial [Streptomyces lacrimifluminis]